MKIHRLIPIIVMALFVFAGCDTLTDGGCTEDKYEVCADGTQYLDAECENGQLFPVDYNDDPCDYDTLKGQQFMTANIHMVIGQKPNGDLSYGCWTIRFEEKEFLWKFEGTVATGTYKRISKTQIEFTYNNEVIIVELENNGKEFEFVWFGERYVPDHVITVVINPQVFEQA